jgi:hypothetical protein
MTQAMNLANFANSLDSSGGVPPTQLNSPVPVSKGGTNASTASAARTNLGLAIGTDVPSPTGTGASGTWNINVIGNVTGNVTGNATGSAGSVATPNFAIYQSGTNLLVQYNGTTVVTISSTGVITSV